MNNNSTNLHNIKIKFLTSESNWEKQVELKDLLQDDSTTLVELAELINDKKLKIYDDDLPMLEFYKQTAKIENGQLFIHLS